MTLSRLSSSRPGTVLSSRTLLRKRWNRLDQYLTGRLTAVVERAIDRMGWVSDGGDIAQASGRVATERDSRDSSATLSSPKRSSTFPVAPDISLVWWFLLLLSLWKPLPSSLRRTGDELRLEAMS